MKKIRVAINGFGRIGRAFYKVGRGNQDIEIVAINDLGDIQNMAYLLRFDTVYGRSGLDVKVEQDGPSQSAGTMWANGKRLIVDGAPVLYLSEKDPASLPWKKLGIDVVVESTGLFTSYEKAAAHITAGAKRVVISAPAKEGSSADTKSSSASAVSGQTVLMGVNEDKLSKCQISSNASCTTNAGSPLIAILNETVGIEKALLNTVHAYTASQSIVDGPARKDWREGRAGAANIVPTSTGAAIATTKAVTDLEGKFDGIAIRVPVPVGSIVDVTFLAKRQTNADEINKILSQAAQTDRWKGIFYVTSEPVVSSDIIGNPHASIADLSMTRVVGGNLVKVLAWYDNEMGYTHTLVRHVIKAAQYL